MQEKATALAFIAERISTIILSISERNSILETASEDDNLDNVTVYREVLETLEEIHNEAWTIAGITQRFIASLDEATEHELPIEDPLEMLDKLSIVKESEEA